MTILLIIFLVSLLAIAYIILMLLYRKGWSMQQEFKPKDNFIPGTKISVIIPARNEAENIQACIRSVLDQSYPANLFDVIVIDDHSTDGTADRVRSFNSDRVRCLSLSDYLSEDKHILAFKKKALATGISQSSAELILTTDADCIAPENWLLQMAAIYERSDPVIIVAPVAFTCNGSIVERFQLIDFMSMQGITVAAHQLNLGNMSNGANLAFSKAAYDSVNGYEGIDHLASGDDYLLMMKLQKTFPGRIECLKSKEAIMHTAPQPGWRSFLSQRIRWASKSGKYDDKKMTLVLSLVYIFNLSFLVLLIAGLWMPVLFAVLLVMLALKVIVELYYLFPVSGFFGQQRQLVYFIFLQPIHIVYIIVAGFLGFAGNYEWKGRRVK